jgi:hypothetical protein
MLQDYLGLRSFARRRPCHNANGTAGLRPLCGVVRTDADTDADVAALWADIGRQRREGV